MNMTRVVPRVALEDFSQFYLRAYVRIKSREDLDENTMRLVAILGFENRNGFSTSVKVRFDTPIAPVLLPGFNNLHDVMIVPRSDGLMIEKIRLFDTDEWLELHACS